MVYKIEVVGIVFEKLGNMVNNKKSCPDSEDCVFLHEDAQNCKYGMQCERQLCMFKHEFNPESVKTEEIVKNILTVDENG